MTAKRKSGVVIKNRRAAFEYELLDTYTAGIVLMGTEIKSIRAGRVSLADAYCYFVGRELYVKNMSIAEYDYGSYNRHEPERDRKLLLNKRELNKLFRATREKGFTIVVTRLFISDNGYAKLNIALARGKRQYDKRHSIKDRDMQRDQDRMLS